MNMPIKTALVSGASKGIGFAIVQHLLKCGWRVGMLARDPQRLNQAASLLDSNSIIPIVCDVSNSNSVSRAISKIEDKFGTITALVNNAGIIDPVGRFHELESHDWINVLNVNLNGIMLLTQAVLPSMIKLSKGVIINLSSGAANTPIDGWSAYCTSKAALKMFSQCIAIEYGQLGIRIHDFIPGLVDTDMLNNVQKKFDNIISKIDDNSKLPPDLPAQCIAWLIDKGEGNVVGIEQSIRDPELRSKVGLIERSKW